VQEAALASNDQFADVLRKLGCEPPTKVSKTTGKEAYAFAKNDALFQALLNGDNEDVALVCEARLKVKSTLERTRAQRFIDIAERGALPVPLSYYGASVTGRWSAAKGSNINLQNMKRGSFLRKSIMAPDGYLLCVGDLSQIEPRVLAWLSDYETMLDIFRAGGDPYATFGSTMFGVPGLSKESHPLLRQSAKSALLGCFGPDTPVQTTRGWVRIADVSAYDMLWDGVTFVQHKGVVPQGEKDVLTVGGLSATADHKILTEAGWWEWQDLCRDVDAFGSALTLSNSPAYEKCRVADPLLQAYGPILEGRDRHAEINPDALSKVVSQRMQTYDIAMAGPRNRYTVLTDFGPIIVHNCGYQLGWASFASQLLTGFLWAPPVRYTKRDCKQLGVTANDAQKFLNYADNVKKMSEIPHTCTEEELLFHCLAAKAIVDKYRAAASPVVDFWELLGTLMQTCLVGGEIYEHKGVLQFRRGAIEMVSGMEIRYPDLKAHVDKDDPKKRVVYTYDTGRGRTKLYPGKICNNCIGENTPVLTDRGWVPIESVRETDRVHDGNNFVQHTGLIGKGVQRCVTVDGVYMTPDHEVLTNDGWQEASQVPRPYRPDLRHVEGATSAGERQGGVAVALFVRVRQAVREIWSGRGQGAASRRLPELRMRNTNADRAGEPQTRTVPYTNMDRVGQHARPLSQPRSSRVQELRGSWHHSVRSLGHLLRELLGGHGTHVPGGVGFGAQGQQSGVLTRQLCVGVPRGELYEPPQHSPRSGRAAVERTHGYRKDHDIQPHTRRVAGGGVGETAGVFKQVFDLTDCGPQNRFVVRGAAGPFIVHNCTQGLARCVMSDGLLRVQKSYRVLGTVHDEGINLIPEADAEIAVPWVRAQMVQVPKWLPGIPLDADVGVAKRYGDVK
jgi:hypothetical protein